MIIIWAANRPFGASWDQPVNPRALRPKAASHPLLIYVARSHRRIGHAVQNCPAVFGVPDWRTHPLAADTEASLGRYAADDSRRGHRRSHEHRGQTTTDAARDTPVGHGRHARAHRRPEPAVAAGRARQHARCLHLRLGHRARDLHRARLRHRQPDVRRRAGGRQFQHGLDRRNDRHGAVRPHRDRPRRHRPHDRRRQPGGFDQSVSQACGQQGACDEPRLHRGVLERLPRRRGPFNATRPATAACAHDSSACTRTPSPSRTSTTRTRRCCTGSSTPISPRTPGSPLASTTRTTAHRPTPGARSRCTSPTARPRTGPAR